MIHGQTELMQTIFTDRSIENTMANRKVVVRVRASWLRLRLELVVRVIAS